MSSREYFTLPLLKTVTFFALRLLSLTSCATNIINISIAVRAEEGTPDMDTALTEIYNLYADCALKDPFYELEMPIRSTLFTQSVDSLMERLEKASSGPSKR